MHVQCTLPPGWSRLPRGCCTPPCQDTCDATGVRAALAGCARCHRSARRPARVNATRPGVGAAPSGTWLQCCALNAERGEAKRNGETGKKKTADRSGSAGFKHLRVFKSVCACPCVHQDKGLPRITNTTLCSVPWVIYEIVSCLSFKALFGPFFCIFAMSNV